MNWGNLAPAGWHVPSVGEWDDLINFLGGTLTAGGKMKEAGTAHWNAPNTAADNSSGYRSSRWPSEPSLINSIIR